MRNQSVVEQPIALDPSDRFVKVSRINPQGFVEFEFAIGTPELCVELMLPPTAFEEFCLAHKVSRLDAFGSFVRH